MDSTTGTPTNTGHITGTNPGDQGGTSGGGISHIDSSWTDDGPHKFIGIIIVIVMAFIILLLWTKFARWPRQRLRTLLSSFSSKNKFASSSTPASSLEKGEEGADHNRKQSENGSTVSESTKVDRPRGGGGEKNDAFRQHQEPRVQQLEEVVVVGRGGKFVKVTVWVPEKPTPAIPKKSRTYGHDWLRRYRGSSPSSRSISN